MHRQRIIRGGQCLFRERWVFLTMLLAAAGVMSSRGASALPKGPPGPRAFDSQPLSRTPVPGPVRWTPTVRTAEPTPAAAPIKTDAIALHGTPGSACVEDEQCGRGTYCDQDHHRCVRIRKHINIMYLFYRSRDRRFTELLGIYWHRKGKRGYRVAFPLYWSFWGPGRRTRMVVPFFFDSRRGDRRQLVIPPVEYMRSSSETALNVWPLFFHTGYRKGGHSTTLLPLFHRSRTASKSMTVLPLLLTFARSDSSAAFSQGLAGGLFYWRTKGRDRTRALIPLVWHRSSPGGGATWTAPFNLYRRRGEVRSLLSVPLFYHRWDPSSSTTVSAVPPLYHHRSPNRRRLYLPPLFAYHRTGGARTVVVGPAYVHRREAGASEGQDARAWHTALGLAPLLFSGWSPGRRHLVLFPALWHFRSPGRRTWIVGPGYFHQRGDRLSLGLAPLLFYGQSPGRRRLLAPPLLYHDRVGPRLRVMSPLAIYDHDRQAGRRQLTLTAPPFYHRRDPRWEVDVAPPLFARWRDRKDLSTTWVLGGPLVLHRHRTGDSQVLFPLFWRFSGTGRRTWVVGPGYYHRRDDQLSLGLAPLLFYRQSPGRRRLLALPLLFHDQVGARLRVVTPLGIYNHDRQAGRRQLTLTAPPFYHRRDPRWEVDVAPPLFARWRDRKDLSTTWVLGGPLVLHRHRTGDSQVLFPLFWRFAGIGRRTWVVGPGYYHRRRGRLSLGLAPLVFYDRTPDRRSLTVAPLFHHRVSGDGARARFLSPLFMYSRDRTRGRTTWATVAPFYYRHRDRRREVDVAPPLFARWRDREQMSTTWVFGGPLVIHRHRAGDSQVLFPLFWRFNDHRAGSVSMLLPVAYHRRYAAGNTFSIFGPAFLRRAPNRWSAGLAPLLFVGRNRDRRHLVLFPVLWRFDRPHRSFTLAGPVLWSRSRHSQVFGVLPLMAAGRWGSTRFASAPPLLFHHHHDLRRGTSFTLAGLYTRRKKPTVVKHSVWPLVHVTREETPAGESLNVSAIPLFSYSRSPRQSRLISPLGGFSRSGDRLRALGGPFYYSRSAGRRTVAALPLFFASWDRRRTGFRVGLAPVFYLDHRAGERTGLYTAAFGFRRRGGSLLWYAAPILSYRSPDTRFTMALPVGFWHQDRARGAHTVFALPGFYGRWSRQGSAVVAFPLIWRWRRPASSVTIAFPAYWDVHHRGTSRTTVAFPFYVRHRDVARRTTTHLTPLTWVRRRPGGTDAVVFPLVWHFGAGRRSASVAFPFYWRFSGQKRRATVVFPVYWDFRHASRRTTVVLNTLYIRDRDRKTYDFHFLPLLRVQRKRPADFKISFVGGLFGYERIGSNRFLKLFLIPIELARKKSALARPPSGPRHSNHEI